MNMKARRFYFFCWGVLLSAISTDAFVQPKSSCTTRRTGVGGKLTTSTLFKRHHESRTNVCILKASLSETIVESVASRTIPPLVESLFVACSILILAGYHAKLFAKEKAIETKSSGFQSKKVKTWRQYQADTREDWARHVRNTEGWLYAIQTLRNAITSMQFLATTVLSLLTLITGRMWDLLRSTQNMATRRLLTLQLISIVLPMLFSAYQFIQAVRLMTHAGFMFPVKADNTKVDNIMRQTQNCQWTGLRWMYLSLAPISWAVGDSRMLLLTSLGLLLFFKSIDKQPEGLGYDEFQGSGI
ncbi:hypothetical protein CTEN210_04930 [Chaetoceros tenuissimus]|uniref:Uncharacterized protein n=1 Tax=Chaetoceros tenuissimus TaxID=426638 RepID=A0AAD3H3D8_9STRA|nr:hypothetical protein CTEN210_04930 [Chaetoceros tenuissimus]